MVRRGLKKGDVFENGGLYYEVQSVLPNGDYISKRVTDPKKIAAVEDVTGNDESTGGEQK